MISITVLTFGGVSALPIRIAQMEGLLKAAGMTLQVTSVNSSAQIRTELEAGSASIAHLAPDNVISWSDDGLPIRAWLAGSNGPIALIGRGVGDTAELRGRRIGVDSVDSGFVTILRGLLDQSGVTEADVELVQVGATRLRYQALIDGAIDATMLSLPWSSLALRRGGTLLGDHRHVAPGLLTSCAASLSRWLDEAPEQVEAYAEALASGIRWLHERSNRGAAAVLLAEDLGIDADTAGDVLDIMADSQVGWPDSVRLASTDLGPTLALRAGTMGQARRDAHAYVATTGDMP